MFGALSGALVTATIVSSNKRDADDDLRLHEPDAGDDRG